MEGGDANVINDHAGATAELCKVLGKQVWPKGPLAGAGPLENRRPWKRGPGTWTIAQITKTSRRLGT